MGGAVPELDDDEIWLLRSQLKTHGLTQPHRVSELSLRIARSALGPDPEPIVDRLVEKQVLSRSPDGLQVRITDYGLEVYGSLENSQKHWESQPLIRISTAERSETLIRAGEPFLANRLLRDVLRSPASDLRIVDPFLGSLVFDILEDVNPGVPTKLLTSTSVKPAVLAAYRAFRSQYTSTELRIADASVLHDRFILWDGQKGLQFGHSLKDLGTKDTRVSIITNVADHYANFEERWGAAEEPQ